MYFDINIDLFKKNTHTKRVSDTRFFELRCVGVSVITHFEGWLKSNTGDYLSCLKYTLDSFDFSITYLWKIACHDSLFVRIVYG